MQRKRDGKDEKRGKGKQRMNRRRETKIIKKMLKLMIGIMSRRDT